MNDQTKSTGAVTLAVGGVASAFALAACCAVPALLAGVGLGAVWLQPIVSISQPHAQILTVVSAAALIGSVALVIRSSRQCAPGSVCARPWFRRAIIVAAAVGAVLLVASKLYA